MCRSPSPPARQQAAAAPAPSTPHAPPSVCTFNLNGMTAYSLTVDGKRRAGRMRANLATLTTSYGICHFQETHLLPNDKRPLTRIAPHHTIFTSNLSSASAGVATAISPDVGSTGGLISY